MADKPIKVKSVADDGRTILWEVDERHPGGEIFLSNNQKVKEVFETPRINALLNSKVLVRVGKAKDEPKDPDPKDPPPPDPVK